MLFAVFLSCLFVCLFLVTLLLFRLYFVARVNLDNYNNHLLYTVTMSSNNSCKILSLNVRGIREATKRRGIFSYLKDEKASFYFLQEIYSEITDEDVWENEWGGEIILSHGSNRSRGVCVLIDPLMKTKVDHSFKDNSGRIVLITIQFNNTKLSLCNIYAPNNLAEQVQFIQDLNCFLMDKSELTTLIPGGDWNCTLSKIDKSGGAKWKPTNSRNMLLITMEMFDLIDIQRKRHPNLKRFSYCSKSFGVKSRIDYFLIASGLKAHVKKSDILPSIAPYHSTILLVLTCPEPTPRGPGFWKLNNALLQNTEYKEMVRERYPLLREKFTITSQVNNFSGR